ncbi:FAD/NAD(P)-binding protein [Glarea lozoyensis ATCC 20868]|uniref:FAD/NAD(P)-binding protein n=1 Tax=Glarea lozoyensis (strain ATCC 20868 / MF5171) TaxID=1116229 RepID=S3DAM0_GLAL2|nr:FAD/NAD(P)-binding protein [Glarea lozoyensis ATCC 20868]EPE29026.1 FAD/NAD(P)-binding protein [Glarea lozoyensis ATCC 20868]
MDARTNLPVFFPRPDPTASYWQNHPDPYLGNVTDDQDRDQHVIKTLLIGSGITGASVAWNILQQPPSQRGRVVMLEARPVCSGATGRNGGHTKGASYRSFPSNYRTLGKIEAIKIARLEYANIRATHQFAAEHKIDCESRSCDTVDAIYDPVQWEECASAVKLMKDCFTEPGDAEGIYRYHLWTPEEAKEKFHIQGTGPDGEPLVGAVSYEAGSIHAYRFVTGVLNLCVQEGLELRTNTPATKTIRTSDGKWSVETPQQTFIANRVVLATNGYTAALCPEMQGVIVPLRGQVTAHRSGTNMPKTGLVNTFSFVYKNGFDYMIPRPAGTEFEGDIIIGGGLFRTPDNGLEEHGNTDDTSLNSAISSYLHESTPTYFGNSWGEDQPEGRIRQEWTGIMGYTLDGFPHVGHIRDNLWIGAGFQGHGMVLCWLSGKALVEKLDGIEGDVDSWFPKAFWTSEERRTAKGTLDIH